MTSEPLRGHNNALRPQVAQGREVLHHERGGVGLSLRKLVDSPPEKPLNEGRKIEHSCIASHAKSVGLAKHGDSLTRSLPHDCGELIRLKIDAPHRQLQRALPTVSPMVGVARLKLPAKSLHVSKKINRSEL